MPFVGETFVDDDRLLDDDLHYGVAFGKHLNEDWSAQLESLRRRLRRRPFARGDAVVAGIVRWLDRRRLVRPHARVRACEPLLAVPARRHRHAARRLRRTAGRRQRHRCARHGGDVGSLPQRRRLANGAVAARSPHALGHAVGQHAERRARAGRTFVWFGPAAPGARAGGCPAASPPPPPPPAKCSDGDNDGVCDADDKCPGTPAGIKVDSVGCPLEQRLKLLFDFDSAELRPESISELERLVKFMSDVPFATALIEGHTDSVGTRCVQPVALGPPREGGVRLPELARRRSGAVEVARQGRERTDRRQQDRRGSPGEPPRAHDPHRQRPLKHPHVRPDKAPARRRGLLFCCPPATNPRPGPGAKSQHRCFGSSKLRLAYRRQAFHGCGDSATDASSMAVQRYHPGHLWLPCSVGGEGHGRSLRRSGPTTTQTVRRKF